MQNSSLQVADNNKSGAGHALANVSLMVTSNAPASNVTAGLFVANLASGTANVGVLSALTARVQVPAGANVQTVSAAIIGSIDMSGATLASNAIYGAILDRAKAGANSASAPTAFIGFGEESVATPVSFLFDIGRPGKNTPANTGILSTEDGATANGCLRIRVNGATKYIQLYDTLA